MAIIKKSVGSVYQLPETLTALALADANEAQARIDGDLVEKTRAMQAESDLGVRIDNVLDNTDPAAIDSLREIVTAYTAADSTLNGAITTLAQSAGTGLATEIANRIEAVRLGSVLPKMESLTVAAGKIGLTHAPKSGVDGIMGYGRVSYVDANNVELLADVTLDVTDTSGKTFIVNTDVAGEWDTKSVKVQYWYIAAA